jgi:hypothetical protein
MSRAVFCETEKWSIGEVATGIAADPSHQGHISLPRKAEGTPKQLIS